MCHPYHVGFSFLIQQNIKCWFVLKWLVELLQNGCLDSRDRLSGAKRGKGPSALFKLNKGCL